MDQPDAGSRSLVRVIDGEVMYPPPIWFMRQAGRYLPEYRRLRAAAGGFLELCLDSRAATEVTLQPVRRFGLDAAILFSDILIVPYALGAKLWFEENEGPRLEPVADWDSFDGLRETLDEEVVGSVYETLDDVRAKLPRSVALIGFCGAPWTVATYLVAGRGSEDQAAAKQLARSDPRLFAEIIDRLVSATAAHLVGQLRAGADVVMLFDTWAGVLDEASFRRWCIEPVARIIGRVRAAVPRARFIVFPRGVDIADIERLVRETAADVVSLDWSVNRVQARERLGELCALQGNLNPETLLFGGDRLDREVDAILREFAPARHIFNLGHGIRKETPVEHVEQVVRRVRRGA